MRNILLCIYLFIFFVPLAIAEDNEATANIKKALESNKCNWTFVDMPFQEVMDFISNTNKINIVIDPRVARLFLSRGIKVSLHVTDMRLKDAFNLLLDMYSRASRYSQDESLCYTFCNDVLFITHSSSELSRPPAETVFHDISMISLKSKPTLIFARKLQDGIQLPYSLAEELQIRGEKNDSGDYCFSETIQELIKACIARETWCTGNYSIEELENNGLMVINTPDVQEEISAFLKELTSFSTPPIPIELWCFEVDNSILVSSRLYCSPTVDEKTMGILEDSVRTGNGRVILHAKADADNHILFPLVIRGKSDYQSLIEIFPTLYPNKQVLIEMASIIRRPYEFQDTSVEKTGFQNFGSAFLLSSGKINTIALSPACNGRSFIILMRVIPEQWEPVVKPLEVKISPEEQMIRQKLREKKINLNFKGTPLGEAINFMSSATGINMIVTPDVYKKVPQNKELKFKFHSENGVLNIEKEELKPPEKEVLGINLTCSDVSCESVLDLILEQEELTYRIYCDVIVISPKTRNTPVLRMYDTQDIRLNPCYDFFSTGKIKSSPFEYPPDRERSYADFISPYTMEDDEVSLIHLIKDNIGVKTWDESWVSLDVRKGILIIRQVPEVHEEAFRFIDYLRSQHRKNRRMISIWAYLAPKDSHPETMALLATCNRQKVCLKSGVLYMGNTPKDKERRKEEVDYLDTQINLQDQIEKREAMFLSVTPLLKKEVIELALELKTWGNYGFERNLTAHVPNGKTVPAATIPGDKEELTLFVGAFVEQEE